MKLNQHEIILKAMLKHMKTVTKQFINCPLLKSLKINTQSLETLKE